MKIILIKLILIKNEKIAKTRHTGHTIQLELECEIRVLWLLLKQCC